MVLLFLITLMNGSKIKKYYTISIILNYLLICKTMSQSTRIPLCLYARLCFVNVVLSLPSEAGDDISQDTLPINSWVKAGHSDRRGKSA